MELNKYDGCLEQWKVDLIVHRALALGFREDEILDIQQDLVLEVMNFKYDPEHSKGAQENTVLQALIDNQLMKRRRSEQRRNDHTAELRWITELEENDSETKLSIDIENAIRYLPNLQRQICIALSEGCSIPEIAKAMGIHRITVYRHIRKIRDYFKSLGLDQWIGC